MSTSITGSPNISVLDSKVIADLCNGIFFIDISPSVYIGSGALNVLGANVKVTNPLSVIIKNFSTSGYDIEGGSPPMQDVVEVGIPTTAGNYQYGAYSVEVVLYDASGTEYKVTKTVTISVPNEKDATKKYGIITATIKGLCKDGRAVFGINTPPLYRGKQMQSSEQEFTVLYPTGSSVSPEVTSLFNFSLSLYEGWYKITGEVCALYNLGDGIYAKIKYKLNCKKKLSCIINHECIGAYIEGLNAELDEVCTDEERQSAINRMAQVSGIVTSIEYLAYSNQDTSNLVNRLEEIIGCPCTCECNVGVPIINNEPAKDFLIEGCGVEKTTVGLTDHYTINNYGYELSVNENGLISIGTPTLNDCKWTIPISVNVNAINEKSYQYHYSGSTVTILDSTDVLIIDPEVTLAALEIKMPANLRKDVPIQIWGGNAIGQGNLVVAALTVVANAGQTLELSIAPSELWANDTMSFMAYTLSKIKRL